MAVHHWGQTSWQFQAATKAAGVVAATTASAADSTGDDPLAAPQWAVTIFSRNPRHSLTAMLGDTAPGITGGGGGYEQVPLPERLPIAVWRGPASLVMTLPIVVDNFTASDDHPLGGRSAQGEIDELLFMYGAYDREHPPPMVKLTTTGRAIPYLDRQWYISNIVWGAVEANSAAHRSQQHFEIELTEFRADDWVGQVKVGSAAKARQGKSHKTHGTKPGGPVFIRVRPGQTLRSIAADLGLPSWRTLAAAQHPPVTDPRKVKVGDRLRLPKGFGMVKAA